MSEIPKCEHCGSTNLQHWENKKSWFSVIEVVGNRIRIGKPIDDDVYDSGFMCTECLKDQPALDDFEKEYLS